MSAHSRESAFPTKRILLGATAAAAVAVIFGSVHTTGALWRDSAVISAGTVTAGVLSLSTGAGSNPNYTFSALTKSNVLPGDVVQKPLVITNTGSADLAYRLTAAGPSVSGGPGVTVSLAGTVVPSAAACTDNATPVGATAFTTFTTSSAGTAATSAPRPLAIGTSEVWCVRSLLVSSKPTSSSTYTHNFSFGAVST